MSLTINVVREQEQRNSRESIDRLQNDLERMEDAQQVVEGEKSDVEDLLEYLSEYDITESKHALRSHNIMDDYLETSTSEINSTITRFKGALRRYFSELEKKNIHFQRQIEYLEDEIHHLEEEEENIDRMWNSQEPTPQQTSSRMWDSRTPTQPTDKTWRL